MLICTLAMGLKPRVFETFKKPWPRAIPSLGKGRGFANYANRLETTEKPLPATAQSGAPRSIGGSLSGYIHVSNGRGFKPIATDISYGFSTVTSCASTASSGLLPISRSRA